MELKNEYVVGGSCSEIVRHFIRDDTHLSWQGPIFGVFVVSFFTSWGWNLALGTSKIKTKLLRAEKRKGQWQLWVHEVFGFCLAQVFTCNPNCDNHQDIKYPQKTWQTPKRIAAQCWQSMLNIWNISSSPSVSYSMSSAHHPVTPSWASRITAWPGTPKSRETLCGI